MTRTPRSPAVEFSRPIEVDRVPRTGSHEKLRAEAGECEKLARRLAVPRLFALTAALHAAPWRGGGLKVTGSLTAELEQLSVVSLEPFRTTVTFPVERYFLPAAEADADGAEDADPIHNGVVDLGEMVAETLSLELDPYPRRPGEVFAAGTATGEDDAAKPASPFSHLEKLRNKDR